MSSTKNMPIGREIVDILGTKKRVGTNSKDRIIRDCTGASPY
jgi:hypothetical protein